MSNLEGLVFEDRAGIKYLIYINRKEEYQVVNLNTEETISNIVTSIHNGGALRDIKRGIEGELQVSLVKRYRIN